MLANCHVLAVGAESRESTAYSFPGKSAAGPYSRVKTLEKQKEYAKSLAFYNAVALKYTDAMNRDDKLKCAKAFCHSGDIYYENREYSSAMSQYLGGLRIAELNAFNLVSGQIYTGIGNLYSSHGDFEMGIRYYKQALDLAAKECNRNVENKILNNLIGASCFAGKAAEGRKYLGMLLKNKENNSEYAFNARMCCGIVALELKDTVQAISCYSQALAYAKAHKLGDAHTTSANSCLAQIFVDMGKPDAAIPHLRENEQIANATGQGDLLAETMRNLSFVYELKGNRDKASSYKTKYVDMFDSLYNNKEFNTLKNTMFLYEASKSENAIRSLKKEKQDRDEMIAMQRKWIVTLVLAFLVFIVMLVVVYRQKRQLFTAYRELYSRNQQYLTGRQDAEAERRLTKDQRTEILDKVERVMLDAGEICDSNFNIDRLALLVGSNSRYVSEAINEEYGKNFRTYLNEYRIKEAMRRLADTEHYGSFTIKAISESVGYKSQANFISVFTKVTGMKPSIYQKISKE